MRVTIVSCVYPPEPVVSARTSADLAEALRQRGHEVRVITSFPHRPGGRVFPGYRRRLRQVEGLTEGKSIERVFGLLSRDSGVFSRLGEALSFGITSAWAAIRGSKPDVAYVNSWPLVGSGLAVAAFVARGVPTVLSIQDVYPESLVAQGRIVARGRIARLLTRLDAAIARRAAAVIVIGPRFARRYSATRGLATERVHLVPNWLDASTTGCDPEGAFAFRQRAEIPADAFLAVFGGNVNSAAGVETLIAAMEQLENDPHMHLVVAGEGSELDRCIRRARGSGLARVHFHSPWAEAETGAVLGSADVLLLPTRGDQSGASMPSKLISYLLAGKPVIALATPESDLADWVEHSGAGWVVPPDDPSSLAAQLRRVSALTPAERAAKGRAGAATALREMTRDANLPKLIRILEESCGKRGQVKPAQGKTPP